jgi:hypothetical protein
VETADPLLERLAPALAAVPGVLAFALGGSRATGAAHAASDYDIGLYFGEGAQIDVARLLLVVQDLVDVPMTTAVTEVGGWGPWIGGGGWLSVDGMKVDILYRPLQRIEKVIFGLPRRPRHDQLSTGHPHGFCSAIWMGEVALCRPLSHAHASSPI